MNIFSGSDARLKGILWSLRRLNRCLGRLTRVQTAEGVSGLTREPYERRFKTAELSTLRDEMYFRINMCKCKYYNHLYVCTYYSTTNRVPN